MELDLIAVLIMVAFFALRAETRDIDAMVKSTRDELNDFQRRYEQNAIELMRAVLNASRDAHTDLDYIKAKVDVKPAHRRPVPEAIDYETSQRLALEKLEKDNSHGVPV